MKTFKLFLLGLITLFTLNSCMTAYAQYDEDGIYQENVVTYSTVVTYGTPFYIDGIISYYLYNNIYYYPYIWNNVWYFHPFNHIQPRGFIYKPDRFHRPFNRLGDMNHHYQPNFGNRHVDMGRNIGVRTPNSPRQSSTRITVNGNRGNGQNRIFTPSGNRGINGGQNRTFTPSGNRGMMGGRR